MCILCAIQKWSRRVATMLPWLVIPLIGLWALSQLLPPAFRFEITSARLACVSVLLVTLFWYEILMPQLSAWRVRRNTRIREQKRVEAIEMEKLRKNATRRCRNCLTPYRDQNPGGGRFMCSYCGHISKRPALDLPVPPGLGISSSGIFKGLIGKGGKILTAKVWSDNGWPCTQVWLENRNWVGGSFAGKSSYWRKNEHCFTENSYSGIFILACKLLASFFLSIRWIWRKIFRTSSSRDDELSDADHRGMLIKGGENGPNFHESRGEKARRKAEEKRQARLEKELLEEEERKQREEVARLVEERRRLRDEKIEAEKGRSKASSPVKEKNSKKEAEKKRQERRKERDKSSSKSNSDVEELERRSGKESERKRESQRNMIENMKTQNTEMGHALKAITSNSYGRGNAGTRYFDRMRGTFLSPSKAFFGKDGANTAATMSKDKKFGNSIDHVPTTSKRDLYPPAGKVNTVGDDKNANAPILLESQPRSTPKKSWQQLFTRSSAVTPSSSTSNVISRPNGKSQIEGVGHQLHSQPFDNPINFGIPSPFNLTNLTMGSSISSNSPCLSSSKEPPIFPPKPHEFLPEEPELFEDPCYVPDPVSLLGPVSESLDNFQLDLGMGFGGLDGPRALKNVSASSEISRPSPIGFPSTPQAQDIYASPMAGVSSSKEQGAWQMWNTSPLGQDVVHSSSQRTMASLFNEDKGLAGTQSPQNGIFGNCQSSGPFGTSVIPSSSYFCQPLPGIVTRNEEASQHEIIYGSPNGSTINQPFDLSPASCWSKNERPVQDPEDGVGNLSGTRPHIGGLYSDPDVQSLWSFD